MLSHFSVYEQKGRAHAACAGCASSIPSCLLVLLPLCTFSSDLWRMILRYAQGSAQVAYSSQLERKNDD